MYLSKLENAVSEFISSDSVDLTNCDREAIHLPGATQPHGILFVLSEPDLKITQLSNNTGQLLGIEAAALLGRSLTTLLDNKQIAAIHACLQQELAQPNPLKLAVQTQTGQAAFNGIVHRSTSNHVILELEPLDQEENGGFLSFYQLTIATLDRIQRSANLNELSIDTAGPFG
jgi:light-regulated signal transduction histidine kinase (bacteriophytochrome)